MAGELQVTKKSGAVAKRDEDKLLDWLKSPSIAKRITDVASNYITPERFLRLTQMVVYQAPLLQQCRRDTILRSIIEASARGFELGTDAHLVPYKTKHGYECQLIPDYRGLRKTVLRSGRVTRMKAGVVFQGEEYVWEEGGDNERFEYKPKADLKGNEKILFAWARAWLADGTTQFCIVREFEVMRAKEASRGSGSQYSPWNKYPDRMWAKTALRRLCNELGDLGEEVGAAMATDNGSYHFGKGMPPPSPEVPLDGPEPEGEEEVRIVDSEPAEPEAPAEKPKRTRKKKAAEPEPGGDPPPEIDTVFALAKKRELTQGMVMAAASNLEDAEVSDPFKMKPETLHKLHEMLQTDDGSVALEEHAVSWSEKHGG